MTSSELSPVEWRKLARNHIWLNKKPSAEAEGCLGVRGSAVDAGLPADLVLSGEGDIDLVRRCQHLAAVGKAQRHASLLDHQRPCGIRSKQAGDLLAKNGIRIEVDDDAQAAPLVPEDILVVFLGQRVLDGAAGAAGRLRGPGDCHDCGMAQMGIVPHRIGECGLGGVASLEPDECAWKGHEHLPVELLDVGGYCQRALGHIFPRAR